MPFPKMKMLFLAPVAFSGGKPEFHFSRKCSTDPRIMPAPTIVFDLDGTLVDTAPDLIATLNTILAREGLPPVAFAAQNRVEGGDEVGRGIDQRPVEIENDGGGRHDAWIGKAFPISGKGGPRRMALCGLGDHG